jgi:nitroreductase
LKEVLAIPDGFEPIVLTPLGYPDESPQARGRKTIDEIIHWNKW